MRRRMMARDNSREKDTETVNLNRQSLHTYRRLLKYVRPYSKWMIISIIALLFSVGLGLVLPLVVKNLVDVMLVDNDMSTLNQVAIGLMGVLIATYMQSIWVAVAQNVLTLWIVWPLRPILTPIRLSIWIKYLPA